MAREASIRIVPGGWGSAGLVEIAAVLHDAGWQLLRHFPDTGALTIEVARAPDNTPRAAYRRQSDDPYTVFLVAEGPHWPRFAYQFSHELAHILMGYERLRHRENQWFHECLCETAAWFTVERMAADWADAPPFAGWEDQADSFHDYLQRAGGSGEPGGAGALAGWLEMYETRLRGHPYMRRLNQMAVLELLPLFRTAPEHWPAIAHLPDSAARLDGYLADWRAACPPRHAPMVDRIAAVFGLALDPL